MLALLISFFALLAVVVVVVAILTVRRISKGSGVPTAPLRSFDELLEEAIRDQIEHEKLLARRNVHFWAAQRERAVVQRLERRMGKVSSQTIRDLVRQELRRFELVKTPWRK